MLAAITAALGIIATILAWTLNPKRRLYAELDNIYKELEKWYVERDDALATNDMDRLSVATASIVKLCTRKAYILERLGKGV